MAFKLTPEKKLHLGRAVIAIFALLVAAGHLAYTIPISSSSGFAAPQHISNSINSTTTHTGPPSGGFNSFNMLGFWFDVEVIAYTIIAVVFLFGIRTWYISSLLFNIFNIVLYFGFFPSHFNVMFVLSTTNLIELGWFGVLVIGLFLLKYDPGSEIDRLLVTKKRRKN